jgi:quinol monooxygenase YgiN
MKIDRRTILTGGTSLAVAAVCGDTLLAGEPPVKLALPKGAFVLLAQLQAKEGEEEAVGKALLAMVEPTRKEPGCLCYNLHQSQKDKSQFMFYEQWASSEALSAHGKSAHMKAMQQAIDGRIVKGGATPFDLLG